VNRSILVTDGDERSALAAVRSLGRSGHRVYVCSTSGHSISGASRYVAGERAVASPLASPSAFADDLRKLIAEWQIDLLLPMSEQAFNAIFANPEAFKNVSIPAATAEEFFAISDKQRVMEAAAACGLRVPAQVVLSAPGDLGRLNESELCFPLVLKPARSVARAEGRQFKVGVTHCANKGALDRALASIPAEAYPILLQQRVIGPGVGIFLLLWDGELVATFAHRRIREKPPAGGVSVYRESIRADPELVERSRRLLESFGWRGVAMIEYKLDERTGTPFIMEINGRFWGSLQLAIDAGVDFPSLLVARAEGDAVLGPIEYKLGVRSKWEWGEVDHALARLRRTDAQLSLPAGSPGRLRAAFASLIPWRPGDRLEVFRLSDPRPFFRETVKYFGGH
jgi:predicted ATP-grasp superfamily ATP-dependent carboligase